MITSDFENGNIGKVVENPSNTFTMGFGPGSGGLWFHIKLSGCKDKDLKFILKMTRDLNAYSAHWYDGINKNTPVATHDNKNWEKIESGNLNKEARTFTFTYTPGYDFEWIAYFYPFTNWQLDEFLQNYVTNPNFRTEIIGTTPMGREQKLVTITDPGVPDEGKKVVWIISREDAWETGGTFNTRGEIQYLLSDDELALNLRRNVIFKFIPIVSVDGVAEGTILGIGNNANPSNIVYLTKTWMDNPSPKEIENIKNQIRKWKDDGKRIDIIGRHHSWGFKSSISEFGTSNRNFSDSAMEHLRGVTIKNATRDSLFPDFVLTLYPDVAYFDSEMTAVGETTTDIESFGVNTIKTIADYLEISPAPPLPTSANFTHPNTYLNIDEIEAIRAKVQLGQEPWKTAYDQMITDANSTLNMQIPSVTYVGETRPGADIHDYYSDAPNASDEMFDPNAGTDYNSAITAGKAVRDLGLAYAFTGEDMYADKALEFIRAWTINSTTMMNPNFTDNQSQIELSITMPGMFYGADMIWNYQGWDPVEKAGFVSWTEKFLESAKTWSGDNNYENWRLVFISSSAVIAEDPESLAYAFDRWRNIISNQMAIDGRMVKEINRTNSLSYSLYAINAMVQTAEIARHYGMDLYNYNLSDGRSLELTLDYHAPYAANLSAWSYNQITPYAGDNAGLYELAYSFKQKPSYMDVINKWKRPMYEIRTMGPVTLTHAFGEYPASENLTHPSMYLNVGEIEAIRAKVQLEQEPWKTAYYRMITDANSALIEQIPGVTYRGKTPPGGDLHDYFSETPYSGDGVFDPNADRTDYNSAVKVGKAVRNLGLAYAFTGEGKYADKALEFIRAWTIDSTTMMNPSFTNYQSRIELSITMPGMFYGADMIWNYPGWDPVEKAGFVSWTEKFLESAKTWSDGNNYENWRLVFISSSAMIAEDPESLAYAFDRWKNIISNQMATDGRMVKEINRTNSLSYSLYAINAMVQTAEIARHYGVDLYNYSLSDGRSLELTLDYHAPYAANPSTWSHKQITPYAGDNAGLYELAYSFKQKSAYKDVINKWKRPMYEIRTMGPVTLTQAFGGYPFTFVGQQ